LINPDLDVPDDKSVAESLPDDEKSLKTLFLNITALCENYKYTVMKRRNVMQ
jgi:hypothetical protein